MPFKERKLRKIDIAAIADKIGESSKKPDRKTPTSNQHITQIAKKSTKKKKQKIKSEEEVKEDTNIIKLNYFT